MRPGRTAGFGLAAILAGALGLAGPDKVAAAPVFAPNVGTFSLDNGMQVVVIPDHRAPLVTHMVWYKVGAADEERGHSGIAHFLEHLMFKGTKANPEGTFSKTVAEIGGSENAFTGSDQTGYHQTVAKEQLGKMMELEADRMSNLILTDEVVLPERDVILEERRSRTDNDPGALLGEAISAALYQNHPYGVPVIGWRHEMEALTRADAITFYNRYYTPNNAILIVAGDVTVEEVKKLAEATYGKVVRRADPGVRKRAQEPDPVASRIVTLSDPRVNQPSMQRSYLAPSYGSGDRKEALALDVLADILGGGSTSRMYKTLVVEQGKAASAGAWYQGGSLDASRFGVHATPRGKTTLAELGTAVDAVVQKVRDEGVTDEELARAKKRVLAAAVFAQDRQGGLARTFGNGLTTGQSVADVQEWPGRIQEVTAADVKAVAAKYLDIKRSVTGYLINPSTKADPS